MRLLYATLIFFCTIKTSSSHPIETTVQTPWWFATTENPDNEHFWPGFGDSLLGFGWDNLWNSWFGNIFDVQPDFEVEEKTDEIELDIVEYEIIPEEAKTYVEPPQSNEIDLDNYVYSGEPEMFVEYVEKLELIAENGINFEPVLEEIPEEYDVIEQDGFNIYAVTIN